jgi:hypothetical protein
VELAEEPSMHKDQSPTTAPRPTQIQIQLALQVLSPASACQAHQLAVRVLATALCGYGYATRAALIEPKEGTDHAAAAPAKGPKAWRAHSDETKRQAVALAAERGATYAARLLKIRVNNIHRWRAIARGNPSAFQGSEEFDRIVASVNAPGGHVRFAIDEIRQGGTP